MVRVLFCLFVWFCGCTGSSLQSIGLFLLQGAGLVALQHVGSLFPALGIEPESPALEGGFLTTRPPGKSGR